MLWPHSGGVINDHGRSIRAQHHVQVLDVLLATVRLPQCKHSLMLSPTGSLPHS